MQNDNTKRPAEVKPAGKTNKETQKPTEFEEIMNRIHVHGCTIYLQTDTHTRKLTAPQYIRYVRDAVDDALTPSQVEQALDNRVVDAVLDRYAAAPRGLYTQGGRKTLVLNGVDWLEAADNPAMHYQTPADWIAAAGRNKLLSILFAGLDLPRAVYLLRWIQGARARVKTWLQTGRVTDQMPILVLAGDEGCGKSLILNSVLCPLINGWDARDNCPARAVAAARPLLGKFNAEIVRSPLLSIDDEISGLSQRERAALFTACKSACYAYCVSIEGKGLTPIMMSLPWCVCICCNLSDDALKSTPYSADESNKVLALRVDRRAALPDDYQHLTRADAEAAAALIDGFLTAFKDDIAARVTHDPLGRQPVCGWVDPDLRAGLRAISPEGVLMRAWSAIYDEANAAEREKMGMWLKTNTLYTFLMSNARPRDVDALRAAVPTARACGRMLKTLTANGLAKSEIDRHDKSPMYWIDVKKFRDEVNSGK